MPFRVHRPPLSAFRSTAYLKQSNACFVKECNSALQNLISKEIVPIVKKEKLLQSSRVLLVLWTEQSKLARDAGTLISSRVIVPVIYSR